MATGNNNRLIGFIVPAKLKYNSSDQFFDKYLTNGIIFENIFN